MMTRFFFLPALTLLLLASCSSGNTGETSETASADGIKSIETLKAEVKAIEDSLSSGALQMDKASATGVRYAEKCLEITKNYPKSKEAPVYMDRAHMIFSSCEMHRRSVVTGEELIKNYPLYENRQRVLESMATAYDVFIIPRDKQKVEKYYRMILKEYPDLPAEEKDQIEKRLESIDLTFEEFISGKTAKSPVN